MDIKCVVHDDLGRRTEQLVIAGFLPRHWLKWDSQFHSCGTYSVLSRSPSIIVTMLCSTAKMAVMLVQLSLLVITVIHLTSSQSTYDVIQHDCDVSSRWSNEHVLKQLVTAISQLTTAVSELRTDVTELKTGSRQKDATGKLMY